MEKRRKVFIGEIKDINEKDNTLVSFVSTDSPDRMGDIVEPDGVDMKNYRKNPVVLWAHDYATPPIGKSIWIKKQDGGIISKMEFATTPFAQEIFSLYKGGFLNAFSIGFIPKESTPVKEGDTSWFAPQRFIKSELLEYSAVPVPANPEALSLALQKGLKMDDRIKYAIENAHIDDIETKEEHKEVVKTSSGLEELLSENKHLQDSLASLEKENTELRTRLFNLLTKTQQKLSEMAGEDFVGKAHEIIVGAIRKAQGRIN